MDEWKPIERAAFDDLLLREIAEFDANDQVLWSKFQVGIRTAPIVRAAGHGLESVFVVAAIGDRILFFDDVEDEFGVARLPASGPLEEYGTYGDLRFALRGLAYYA